MIKVAFASMLILMMGTAIPAQSPAQDSEKSEPIDIPFKPGEKLVYEISASKLIFSGKVGELTLSVADGPDEPKPGLLELRAEIVSKGFFPKLFGIKMKDRYVSLVNTGDFGLHSSVKIIEDGKKKKEQKSLIDRSSGRLNYVERDLKDRSVAPKTKERKAPEWLQDIVSMCFFFRTRDLKEGAVFPIALTDTGEVYNVEFVVGKREEVKIDAGTFKTVMLDAKIFDGRYIRRPGELLIWVTDDSRRVPVKARLKTNGATANIELKKLKK